MYTVACEQQTFPVVTSLSAFQRETSDDRKYFCASQASLHEQTLEKHKALNYLSSLCASSGFCPSFFISVNSLSKSITHIFTLGPALKENIIR